MENYNNNGGYGLDGYPSEGSNQDENLNASRNESDDFTNPRNDFDTEGADLDGELISSDDLEDEDDFEEEDDSGYFEDDDESAEDTSSDDLRTPGL